MRCARCTAARAYGQAKWLKNSNEWTGEHFLYSLTVEIDREIYIMDVQRNGSEYQDTMEHSSL